MDTPRLGEEDTMPRRRMRERGGQDKKPVPSGSSPRIIEIFP